MAMMIEDDQIYRPRDLAAMLQVSAVTISRAIREGKLKAIRVGGQWRILGADFRRYLAEQTGSALEKRQLPRQISRPRRRRA